MIDVELLQRHLTIFMLGLPRLLASFAVLPIFSRQVLPGLVRNGVVASLALFVYPITAATFPQAGLETGTLVLVVLKEVFIGMLLGFLVTVLFWALESVGFFIDNQRGATMASSLNPLTGSQTSPLAILLTQAITLIFFVSGGFLLFLGGLYQSYRSWPVLSFFPSLEPEATLYFIGQLDHLMALTVLMAAPVIIAMFLTEFGLALISRFAPQLNVFFLAMPIKSAVGTLLLVIYLSLLLGFFGDALKQTPHLFLILGQLLQ